MQTSIIAILFGVLVSLMMVVDTSSAGEPRDGEALPTFNPRQYGAVGDGKANDTLALQKTIDAAGVAGGVVVLSNGTFLSGTLELKSHVRLRIEKGAVLLGSLNYFDYRTNRLGYPGLALIQARGQNNIGIEGAGTIDGQGRELAANILALVRAGQIADKLGSGRPNEDKRPQLIEFDSCKGVDVRGVTLRSAACWVQSYQNCDDVTLEGLTVRSTAYWNNDGIDIVDCRRVRITNCDVDAADDAICFKSENAGLRCEDVLVENCRLRSSASALKFGTASHGGFRNIVVRGLKIRDTYRSAVAIECVDGGTIENIDISDVVAKNTGNAVFIRLAQRHKDRQPGTIEGITIRNMNVEVPPGRPDEGYEHPGPDLSPSPHNLFPASIAGLPGHPVRDVTLKNVTITYGGGARREHAEIPLNALHLVPEKPSDYPEFSMFGELPAWAWYCRHVEGLTFENVTVDLTGPDFRPALVCDDAEKLTLKGFHVLTATEAPMIVFREVRGEKISDSAPPHGAHEWIRVQPTP